MPKTTKNKRKTSAKKPSNSPLKNISGSIAFNKKTFLVFFALFGVIGGLFVLLSHAAVDPKLATTFTVDSPYFQHPAPSSEFKTDGGTSQVLANSVNVAYPQTLWVGPGATFTYHKDNVNPGYIQACFRVRDTGSLLFGPAAAANVTFAITADSGKTSLASTTTTLDYGYHNTTVYGYYPFCVQTSPLVDGKTYNSVEYRVVVNKGAIYIQSLDIHGVDFAYVPPAKTASSPTNTTNTTVSKDANKAGSTSQQAGVNCQVLGCPTTTNQGGSNIQPVAAGSSKPVVNTVVNFSNNPPSFSQTEAEALTNYIGALECAKQPLMEWKDNKCVAMDFSFVPVLMQQVGNYLSSLQQQSSGGGSSGSGSVDLSFLNNLGIPPTPTYHQVLVQSSSNPESSTNKGCVRDTNSDGSINKSFWKCWVVN